MVHQGSPRSRSNPQGREWLCCCGLMHIKTGLLVVGALQFLSIWGDSSPAFAWLDQPAVGALWIIFSVMGIVLLFVGYVREECRFLVFHMIWQVAACVGLAVMALAMILMGSIALGRSAGSQSKDDDDDAKNVVVVGGVKTTAGVLIFGGLCFLVKLGVQVWWCTVVFKGYRFFKEYGKK